MKVLISRRLWLFKYIIFMIPLFMLLNLRRTNVILTEQNQNLDLDLNLQNLNHSRHEKFQDQKDKFLNKNKVELRDFKNNKDELTTTSIFRTTKSPQGKNLLNFVIESNSKAKIRNQEYIDELIAEEIRLENEEPNILPSDKINKSPKFFVILIQIHSRLAYLKELINSLSKTEHIKETLVIFSHDVVDEDMNLLIQDIKFCAVLQIFYPYSIQLNKNQFPGKDQNDCEKSDTKAQAIRKKCNNAYNADSYGHYREDKVVQIKHHWFWKLSFVFEKLEFVNRLKNLQILLLEEDHYLMPDAIHVLRKLSENILSDIDVVSLAHIEKLQQNLAFQKLDKYAKAIWHTSHHNTGLMLGRAQWNMLKDCLNAFCTYDDYNWDWTLQQVSQKCFKLPLVSIYPSSSRVIHIGQCGTHYKGKNCNPKNSVDSLMSTYMSKKSEFFPKEMKFEKVDTGIRTMKKPNGGWSDPRDHQLCKSFLSDQSLNLLGLNITVTK